MEQKTIFEHLGGTYSQQGDYLLPNLTLPDTKEYVIGKYGHLRQRYLKKHRPILYTNLLTSCKLSEHLADIEEECSERMDSLLPSNVNAVAIHLNPRCLIRCSAHQNAERNFIGSKKLKRESVK